MAGREEEREGRKKGKESREGERKGRKRGRVIVRLFET